MIKSIIKGLLTLTMINFALVKPSAADSSDVSNVSLTADRMHQQEVVLTLTVAQKEEGDEYYLIKKSTDGIDFHPIFELDADRLLHDVIVIADHLRQNTITYYQLSKFGVDGEEIISVTTYDPERAAEASMSGTLQNTPGTSKIAGDPHAL